MSRKTPPVTIRTRPAVAGMEEKVTWELPPGDDFTIDSDPVMLVADCDAGDDDGDPDDCATLLLPVDSDANGGGAPAS